VPEFTAGISTLCPLVPPHRSLPPSPPTRTPLNIPLTVQTTSSLSSHHPHSLHHPPPPLLTYPPSADMRLPAVNTSSAGGILFPPAYNLAASSGVSLSIIQTNVITSAAAGRSLPPVMSHSLSSGGVIVVPSAGKSPGRPPVVVGGSSVIGPSRTAACGPGCQCAGPLTRSRKRKLCSGSDYKRGEISAVNVSRQAGFMPAPTGGGKLLRSGTITLE
jgi:hypothetical protein